MLSQWFVRITAHADRLLQALPGLHASGWPEQVCSMQRHWIGLSHGTNVSFQVEGGDHALQVFTTRVDTLYGVSYLAVAPEHPLVEQLTVPERRAEVQEAIATMTSLAAVNQRRTAGEEGAATRGVATGSFCVHPLTGPDPP